MNFSTTFEQCKQEKVLFYVIFLFLFEEEPKIQFCKTDPKNPTWNHGDVTCKNVRGSEMDDG